VIDVGPQSRGNALVALHRFTSQGIGHSDYALHAFSSVPLAHRQRPVWLAPEKWGQNAQSPPSPPGASPWVGAFRSALDPRILFQALALKHLHDGRWPSKPRKCYRHRRASRPSEVGHGDHAGGGRADLLGRTVIQAQTHVPLADRDREQANVRPARKSGFRVSPKRSRALGPRPTSESLKRISGVPISCASSTITAR
jgi:hypothetical protein